MVKNVQGEFFVCFSSVAGNKLRTFLSLFGITIGIVSIISVFTVFDWMENGIRKNIESLGDNTIYVEKWPWTPDPNIKWWDILKWPPPSMEDYEALAQEINISRGIQLFSIFRRDGKIPRATVVSVQILIAATHDFESVRTLEIEKGRYFTQSESASGKPVAIIGAELADKLFDDIDPMGKEITIAVTRHRS